MAAPSGKVDPLTSNLSTLAKGLLDEELTAGCTATTDPIKGSMPETKTLKES